MKHILDKCPNGCNADWKIKSSNTYFGNVELNWPKLFHAFFVKVTLIFLS